MFSEDEELILARVANTIPDISADALGILWTVFKKEAMHRLCVERKPVDLGFMKIFPVPKEFLKEVLGRITLPVKIIAWYANRTAVPSLDPYVRENRNYLKLMVTRDKFGPIRVRSIRGGRRRIFPSTDGLVDKETRSQVSNKNSQSSETVPDPLQAERPGGTAAAPD